MSKAPSFTEFIALASHKLRTPLTGIKWMTELLLNKDNDNLNDQQKELITDITISNERVINLLDDLLTVSRIDAKKPIGYVPYEQNLVEIVRKVGERENSLIPLKRMKVRFKGFPKKCLIELDKEKIAQAFRAIINNALQYGNEASTIIIEWLKDDQKSVKISITDTGAGIPKSIQGKVFRKFFRGENIAKAAPEGHGLGLFIAKRILKDHGATIDFVSKENESTTFTVEIPKK